MKFNDRSMALLGIPDLPPYAFIRKAGGGIIPQGGGGSPASSNTTSTTGLPEWAKGYAQDTLAKQSALSDRPYEAYGGNRIQGFTDLQKQGRDEAAGMKTSPEIDQAMGITGQVAQGGLDTQNFGQSQADQYMNPYMQNVVDIQKREAGRQSGIQGTQQQAQATQAGAFGGSRDAIMRAERERNLGQQMNDIQAQGSDAAFRQAQQQFNADQGRRMQGLQITGNAAGQMGELGARRFQQGMDINRTKSAYGAQEQAMGQQGLNQAYQDFLNQREYPQQQLNNMSNMVRGLPLGSTSTGTSTQNPGSPSFGQMLSSAGTAAYGLKQFFADGGSVDSQQNIESIVSKLSNQQLDQAEEAAKARGDQEQLQAIQMEKAARASMQRGIGAMPVDMDQMLPTEESMARGGIVAFNGASGSSVLEDEDETTASASAPTQGPGNPAVYNEALQNQLAQAKAVSEAKYESMKPEDYNRIIEERRASLAKGIGESPYESMRADTKRLGEESATNLKQGRGLAAIQAAAAMLQGNDLSRGLAAGASTFAGTYGDAVKADQAQKAAIQRMNMNIADAERKEKMGLTKDAIAAADQARKDHQAAQMFGVDKAKALGKVYEGVAKTSKPGAAPKAPPAPKAAEIAVDSSVKTRMARETPKRGETLDMQKDRITSEEAFKVLAIPKTINSFSTGEFGDKRLDSLMSAQELTKQTSASTAWEKASSKLKISPEFLKANDTERKQMAEDAKIEVYSRFGVAPPKATAAAPAAAPAAPKAAPATKAVPASQIPAGTTFGKAVPGKGTEVLKDGKVIGYAN